MVLRRNGGVGDPRRAKGKADGSFGRLRYNKYLLDLIQASCTKWYLGIIKILEKALVPSRDVGAL